jgi:hypothetical protein
LPWIRADDYSGIDFDDAEYGFKEEDKDFVKVRVYTSGLAKF